METTHTVNQLTVKNIKKSIKDRKILEDVSFSVSRGQMFAILGPTGILTFDPNDIKSHVKPHKFISINITTTIIISCSIIIYQSFPSTFKTVLETIFIKRPPVLRKHCSDKTTFLEAFISYANFGLFQFSSK